MKKVRDCLALTLLAALAGCGGHSSNTSSTPAPTGNAITVGGPVNSPTVATVSTGQLASGNNISVPAPVASPVENAELLGVNVLGCPAGGCSASSTGGTISRTQLTGTVLAFGAGLSANVNISISGPPDITISNIQSVPATGTPPLPGVFFDITLLPNAALGARTVVFQFPNNDITTFTGGLEVVP